MPEDASLLDDTQLPRRPWLRRDVPILWRDARSVEVGEAARRVVLADIPRDLLAWARSLRGERTLPDCLATCPDHTAGTQVLQALHAAGALDDAALAPTSAPGLPRALRDRAMRHHAAARHTYTDERAITATDARARATVLLHGRGTLADIVHLTLRQSGIGNIRRHEPPSSASREKRGRAHEIALVILAHQWHPDAHDDAGCLALDLPHLPVSAWGSRGTVGPLVVPGASSCLHCARLHARDRDPAWPGVHLQRTYATPDVAPVDTGLAYAIAGNATTLACAWIEATARTAGRTDSRVEELIEHRREFTLPGGDCSRVAFPPHPLCGCRWPGDEVSVDRAELVDL